MFQEGWQGHVMILGRLVLLKAYTGCRWYLTLNNPVTRVSVIPGVVNMPVNSHF